MHTYRGRYGEGWSWPPSFRARLVTAIPHNKERYPENLGYDPETRTLRAGEGVTAPVSPAAWDYKDSG